MRLKKSANKPAKTTIQLNGKKYNAVTGQLLEHSGSIDGIVGKTRAAQIRTAQHATKSPAASSTLMRTAVKKPLKGPSKIRNVSTPLSLEQNPVVKVPMIGRLDSNALKRAKKFTRNKDISRFGATLKSAIQNSPYTARPEPIIRQAINLARPTSDNLLERAIENAKSHEQPPLSKKEFKKIRTKKPNRGRAAAYTTIGLMCLMVIAYAVYTNMPNVMVKVASARAGFAAVMPSYRPTGYTLTAVNYQPGMITFNFTSNSDNRYFSLTERSSNWDSATLVSTMIIPTNGHNYKKVVLSGQSIYLFGKDQASWISGGIWYQASGNGSLSTNQMLKLAITT